MPFDGKCQNLQTTILSFAKVRHVRTKITDTHTHTQNTHTEMDKPIAIGEILQICLITKKKLDRDG